MNSFPAKASVTSHGNHICLSEILDLILRRSGPKNKSTVHIKIKSRHSSVITPVSLSRMPIIAAALLDKTTCVIKSCFSFQQRGGECSLWKSKVIPSVFKIYHNFHWKAFYFPFKVQHLSKHVCSWKQVKSLLLFHPRAINEHRGNMQRGKINYRNICVILAVRCKSTKSCCWDCVEDSPKLLFDALSICF